MNALGTMQVDHSGFIIAAYSIGFIAIAGFNLWLHFQRRQTLAMLKTLEK